MFFLYDLDQKHWKRWRSIAGQCQRLLTEQPIGAGIPGTIPTDVNTLLGFVGSEGMVDENAFCLLADNAGLDQGRYIPPPGSDGSKGLDVLS